MSFVCGLTPKFFTVFTVVADVETKKKPRRKRKVTIDDYAIGHDVDDSISMVSYAYSNCDSNEILKNDEHLQQSRSCHSAEVTTPEEITSDDESEPQPLLRWLSWRTDPSKTYSDWTIDVIVQNYCLPSNQDDTGNDRRLGKSSNSISSATIVPQQQERHRYHVHKNIIVVESQLFQAVLHGQPSNGTISTNIASSNTVTTTEIVVSTEYEANVFPTFLDYMYSPGNVWIKQHNASGLLSLAKRFGMKRLQWLTKQFLKQQNASTIRPLQDSSAMTQQDSNVAVSDETVSLSSNASTFTQRMKRLRRIVGAETTYPLYVDANMHSAHPSPEHNSVFIRGSPPPPRLQTGNKSLAIKSTCLFDALTVAGPLLRRHPTLITSTSPPPHDIVLSHSSATNTSPHLVNTVTALQKIAAIYSGNTQQQ
jgi:BTB/POZ domain